MSLPMSFHCPRALFCWLLFVQNINLFINRYTFSYTVNIQLYKYTVFMILCNSTFFLKALLLSEGRVCGHVLAMQSTCHVHDRCTCPVCTYINIPSVQPQPTDTENSERDIYSQHSRLDTEDINDDNNPGLRFPRSTARSPIH